MSLRSYSFLSMWAGAGAVPTSLAVVRRVQQCHEITRNSAVNIVVALVMECLVIIIGCKIYSGWCTIMCLVRCRCYR